MSLCTSKERLFWLSTKVSSYWWPSHPVNSALCHSQWKPCDHRWRSERNQLIKSFVLCFIFFFFQIQCSYCYSRCSKLTAELQDLLSPAIDTCSFTWMAQRLCVGVNHCLRFGSNECVKHFEFTIMLIAKIRKMTSSAKQQHSIILNKQNWAQAAAVHWFSKLVKTCLWTIQTGEGTGCNCWGSQHATLLQHLREHGH